LEASGFTQCGVAQADNSHANNGNRNLTGFLMQHGRGERRAGVCALEDKQHILIACGAVA